MTSAAVPPPSGAAAEVFAVRRMVPGDVAFVVDSWLRSAWHSENQRLRATHNRRQRESAGREWYAVIRPRVQALVADPMTAVLVACDKDDRNHIAAWVAIRGGVELRSHIKHLYRGWGVDALLRTAMEDELVGATPRRVEVR